MRSISINTLALVVLFSCRLKATRTILYFHLHIGNEHEDSWIIINDFHHDNNRCLAAARRMSNWWQKQRVSMYLEERFCKEGSPSRKVQYWTHAVVGACLPLTDICTNASAIAGKEERKSSSVVILKGCIQIWQSFLSSSLETTHWRDSLALWGDLT